MSNLVTMNLATAKEFAEKKLSEGNKSDGCTFAPEIGASCCRMHDMLRRFLPEGITPEQADKLFLECMIEKDYHIVGRIYYWIIILTRKLGLYK